MPHCRFWRTGKVTDLQTYHAKLTDFLQRNELTAVLVSKRHNVRYFSGFAGSAGVLLVSGAARKLFVDFRYVEQAERSAPAYEIVRSWGNPLDSALDFIAEQNWSTVGYEEDALTVAEFHKMTGRTGPDRWRAVHLDGLRQVKTGEEIACIAQAAEIVDMAFARILSFLQPGIAEQAVAARLEYEMRKLGSQRTAFDTIIAGGSRSALPHGAASERQLAKGDLVVLDFGAVVDGYHSDMTRTVCLGTADERQRHIYTTVLAAQQSALTAVKAGASCRGVDQVARKLIQDAGFGDHFGHGLGHGVGLAIHESPRLSPHAEDVCLEAGMVVTVEPGIYLPGWGGVRIEDLVVVSETGCQILSQTPKALLELEVD